MARSALVLALVLGLPLAAAIVPFGTGMTGVATQGSATEHHSDSACGDALTPMTLMMRIVTGDTGDVLRLVAHDVTGERSAFATLAKPAIVETTSPDTCAHFTVEGFQVRTVAVFEVTILHR